MEKAIGIDIGSQKTIIVCDDGERILTSTGGMTRPTIVLFGENRLVGEEALPEIMNDNIVTFFNLLAGKKYEGIKSNSFISHTKLRLSEITSGAIGVAVRHGGNEQVISVTAVLGVFLTQVLSEIQNSVGISTKIPLLAFPISPSNDGSVRRALREACLIAGVTTRLDDESVFIAKSSDCLARAYARKLTALKGPEGATLQNRRVLLIEMGHMHATTVLVRVGEDRKTVTIERLEHSDDIGSFYFDLEIYSKLATQIQQSHGAAVEPGSKKGLRLLRACERLRVLLSQLPTASVTVENMSDSGDVNVSFTRDELARSCSKQLQGFRTLLENCLEGVCGSDDSLVAVEICGGGMRMTMAQDLVTAIVGNSIPLGAKLDDGSVAIGAALLAADSIAAKVAAVIAAATPVPVSEGTIGEGESIQTELNPLPPDVVPEVEEETFGLSPEELAAARELELAMRARDFEIRTLQACRNEMEAYILDMRGAPSRKHGESIDKSALNDVLNDHENWLWDNGEIATLDAVKQKYAELKDAVEGHVIKGCDGAPDSRQGGLCSAYMAATEADRVRLEDALAQEAAIAAQEKAAEGGDDEDHDFRKLKKADRMRLVVKNKEEGTELFKGGNIRPAAARYQKALTHAAKFFDLSPEDTEEVNQVKLSIFLNLAQCYLKLENYDNVIRYATDAIGISSTSSKAYFRRAAAQEAKKDYDKALEDLKLAAQHAPEDAAIVKAIDRVKKCIQKEKDKEKKMWGKAFS